MIDWPFKLSLPALNSRDTGHEHTTLCYECYLLTTASEEPSNNLTYTEKLPLFQRSLEVILFLTQLSVVLMQTNRLSVIVALKIRAITGLLKLFRVNISPNLVSLRRKTIHT